MNRRHGRRILSRKRNRISSIQQGKLQDSKSRLRCKRILFAWEQVSGVRSSDPEACFVIGPESCQGRLQHSVWQVHNGIKNPKPSSSIRFRNIRRDQLERRKKQSICGAEFWEQTEQTFDSFYTFSLDSDIMATENADSRFIGGFHGAF